jgi:hypothetical protein
MSKTKDTFALGDRDKVLEQVRAAIVPSLSVCC